MMSKRRKRTKLEMQKQHVRDFVDCCLKVGVSSRKTSALLRDYFGIRISQSTICEYNKKRNATKEVGSVYNHDFA